MPSKKKDILTVKQISADVQLLAQHYEITNNFDEAYILYKKAAKLENPAAQFNLGRCYIDGVGGKTNSVKGIYWLTRSADQGYTSASYLIAECYYTGERGVFQNFEKASYYYRQAATEGRCCKCRSFNQLKRLF